MAARPRRQGWPTRRLMAWWCAALLGLSLVVTGQDWPEWDFAQIIKTAEQRNNGLGSAKDRLQDWAKLLQSAAQQPERQQLDAVNSFFNRQLRFEDDMTVWHQVDYWATPEEALIKGAGDCEDYAIAKYFSLRRLGVPSQKLRITYVKALTQNQAHMVLTYYSSDRADPLVLDNLIGEIRPASQRKDLLPVYAFNAEGIYMPGAASGNKASDTKKLSRWQDLLKKMKAEGFAIGDG
ncbi:MAG: transglutaminase-like cysteine peptidase [Pseudomonas sp.]|uniref:cysteine protease LapG n=1 Tax=Pseudomonas abieticivorans TaxID=2931382 RepID=UPI0020BF4B7B|nr:transglutaminase-like cysteine peptidase [Pseudomonas sp. PIA16]MDE1165920.1 transglutaminase-like cysteine peptidase [Pseudomonas sp.]